MRREAKVGQGRVDKATANLLRLRDLVYPEAENTSSFLTVVTNTGYVYIRADGVHVIPIDCLGE